MFLTAEPFAKKSIFKIEAKYQKIEDIAEHWAQNILKTHSRVWP